MPPSSVHESNFYNWQRVGDMEVIFPGNPTAEAQIILFLSI